MRHFYYILDADNNPIPATFFGMVANDARRTNRHVGDTRINGCRVSTVFLGIDHNHDEGPPILFETMLFTRRRNSWGKLDQRQARYCTWKEAERGHADIARAVKHKNLTFLSGALERNPIDILFDILNGKRRKK